MKRKQKHEFSQFFLIFGLIFLKYLRKDFLLVVESKKVIFGFENTMRVFSLLFRVNYSPSKTNLFFYGMAEKVEKVKGLAVGNLWYSLTLAAQAVSR